MDTKELVGKIASGEVTSIEELKGLILEENPKSKKVKKALSYAEHMMKQEGKKDLNDFLIYFDTAKNPERDFSSDD